MRIIIKPLGLVVILVSIVSALLFSRFMPLRKDPVKPAAAVAGGGSTSTLLAGKNLLVATGWALYTEKEAVATQSTIEVTGLPFTTAFHLQNHTVGKEPWNIGFHNKLDGVSFATGDKIKAHFWARSPQALPVALVLQQSAAPFAESWRTEIILTPDWKEYTFDVDSSSYPPGGAYLSFIVGTKKGTLDIGGIELLK